MTFQELSLGKFYNLKLSLFSFRQSLYKIIAWNKINYILNELLKHDDVGKYWDFLNYHTSMLKHYLNELAPDWDNVYKLIDGLNYIKRKYDQN